jgi:hypothetical protein
MAPQTRSAGPAPPIVSIRLNPPLVLRTLQQAHTILPEILPGCENRLRTLETLVTGESTPDTANRAYKLITKFWSETMSECQRMEKETQTIQALLQIGDFVHDYLLPYADVVASVWNNPPMRISTFATRWSRNGGVSNTHSRETITMRRTVAQVNPLLSAQLQRQELQTVYNLCQVYADRCNLCHNSLRTKSSQEVWNFFKETEQRIADGRYKFANPNGSLYVVRAIQSERKQRFRWTDGNVEVLMSDGTGTGIYVNP